jgi:hypothetical protein
MLLNETRHIWGNALIRYKRNISRHIVLSDVFANRHLHVCPALACFFLFIYFLVLLEPQIHQPFSVNALEALRNLCLAKDPFVTSSFCKSFRVYACFFFRSIFTSIVSQLLLPLSGSCFVCLLLLLCSLLTLDRQAEFKFCLYLWFTMSFLELSNAATHHLSVTQRREQFSHCPPPYSLRLHALVSRDFSFIFFSPLLRSRQNVPRLCNV